jgi:hypothetical protein
LIFFVPAIPGTHPYLFNTVQVKPQLGEAAELVIDHQNFIIADDVITIGVGPMERRKSEGVVTVDVPASEFPVALANRYMEIKRTARL